MKNFGLLLNDIVVKKAHGYKYYSFYSHCRPLKISKDIYKVDVCIANNLLNNLILEKEEDFALALSCLNLLGAGAKQQKNAENSSNKKEDKNSVYTQRRLHLFNIIAAAIDKNIDLKFNSDIDKKISYNKKNEPIETIINTTVVQLGNIQFSYHIDSCSIIDYCEQNGIDIINRDLKWNPNFKMQNGGKELFEFCLHLKNTSNTLTNEKPLEYVKFLRHSYYLDESIIEKDYNQTRSKFIAEDFVKKIDYAIEKETYGKEI